MSWADDPDLVARLRREFDDAFGLPIQTPTSDRVAFVLVRVGAEIHVVSSTELREIARCPPVVAIPSRAPALVGIAALRGSIIGVYDLHTLLRGEASGTTDGAWVLICRDGETALAVDAIEGHVHAPPSAVLPIAQPHADALVRAVLDVEERSYPLIDLASVMRRVGAAAGPGTPESRPSWRE